MLGLMPKALIMFVYFNLLKNYLFIRQISLNYAGADAQGFDNVCLFWFIKELFIRRISLILKFINILLKGTIIRR
jgi:hypothetical protein